MSNINKHWSKLAKRTMDHHLEGSSPTKFWQDASMHQSGKWRGRVMSHHVYLCTVYICGLVMTIKSHRGKWRRSSPANAALRSWSRINWAVNRIWKKMGALRFAKKTTNNVAQHVQWMRSGPSCPSDTDEQADEKPHTSILEFWSPESWLLDD